VVTFNVRVVRHDNLGPLVRVKGQDDKSNNFYLVKPNIPCSGDCTDWFTATVDTTKMPDGLRLFRWYADVEHANGNTQTARSGWPLDVENGKSDSNGATAGQYKYQNWYREANPAKDWGYTGPIITRTGPLTFSVKCTTNGGPAIDRSIIHVDPDFHAGEDGTILKDVAGAFNGSVTVPSDADKLVARCRQEDGGKIHEGVGVMPVD
jgi:hypothetical protein